MKKQPELKVMLHNPNSPEDTQKLLAQWYAGVACNLAQRSDSVALGVDEVAQIEGCC